MENKVRCLLEKLKNNKLVKSMIVVLLIIIVLLLTFGGFLGSNKTSSTETDDYVTLTEKKLTSILTEIDGAGKVSVAITVESGMETVLAMKTTTKETASGKEIEETPIIVNGKTVVLKEMYPKITGVLIVAEGADNISVMKKIQQATISLLDVNINKIEILTMK